MEISLDIFLLVSLVTINVLVGGFSLYQAKTVLALQTTISTLLHSANTNFENIGGVFDTHQESINGNTILIKRNSERLDAIANALNLRREAEEMPRIPH